MSTLNVFQSKYSAHRSSDLHKLSQDQLAADLYVTTSLFKNNADYVLVGTADVTITLFSRGDVVAKQVDSLREQIKQTRSEAQATVMRLERSINELLAIEGAASEVQA